MKLHTGIVTVISALCVSVCCAQLAAAGPWDNDDRGPGGRDAKMLMAQPWVFVGTVQDCGTPGSRIVTSAWLGGMGLPDDGTSPNGASSSATDPHLGLLLNKNGPTTDCSAAGATIRGFRPGTPVSELGFDYRNGTHCGAGAPRFNITTTAGFTYFAGCGDGTQTPAPQDPAQWTRVRFSNAQIFPAAPTNPPFLLGTTQVRSLDIVYDEGTDTASPSDPQGVGLAVIDNIDVNGKLITAGKGIAPKMDNKLRRAREDADLD